MRGLRFRAFFAPRSRRVAVATVLTLALGGGLLASPPRSGRHRPAGVPAPCERHRCRARVGRADRLRVHRVAGGSRAERTLVDRPVPPRQSEQGRPDQHVRPPRRDLGGASIQFGKLTFAPGYWRPYPRKARTSVSDARWPNGTYNLRTTKQDRLSPLSTPASAPCALGAETDVSNPHNVNLANPGKIDQIAADGGMATRDETS